MSRGSREGAGQPLGQKCQGTEEELDWSPAKRELGSLWEGKGAGKGFVLERILISRVMTLTS